MGPQPSASLAEIEAAYRAHAHHVERRAVFLLGCESDAREVVQEVFLSLIDQPGQFRGQSALTTWLYSATLHACLNRLRNQRTRARLLSEREAQLPMPARVTSSEQLVELRALLARLPDTLARVAVYHLADELSQEEIAMQLQCSRRQVQKLLAQLEQVLGATREAAQ